MWLDSEELFIHTNVPCNILLWCKQLFNQPWEHIKLDSGIPFWGNWLRKLLYNGKEKLRHETTGKGKDLLFYMSQIQNISQHIGCLFHCVFFHTFKAPEASFKIHFEFLVTRLCLLKLCIRHGDLTGMSPWAFCIHNI